MSTARATTVVAVVSVILAATQCRNAQARVRESLFRADSLAAVADSTRTLRLELAQLGDSLQVVERRVVQHTPAADELDRALHREPAARVDMRATIASLDAQVPSDTVWLRSVDSVRSARFELRQVPFSARATVELPPPPREGTLSLNIDIDTAIVEVRLGCGAVAGAGVRPATVAVIAPPWLAIRVASAAQSPDVCSPPTSRGPSATAGVFDRLSRRVGVSVGYAVVASGPGLPASGVGIMAGFRLWP